MKYGPLGEMVERAMPHTEADPIGVYAAALSLWSSAISGRVRLYTGRPVVVWTVLVGRSSLGRKGYALRTAGASLAPSIGEYLDQRTRSGISSGPSLVHMLYTQEERTAASEGGSDGRLLLVEEEWAAVLKIAKRCRTFSQQMRAAWDGSPMRNRTKESYEEVLSPLLGFHGHITPGEWAQYISATDALGGTYNRMLPVAVERSKTLPYNHVPHYEESEALTDAYGWATARDRMVEFAPAAGRRYDEIRQFVDDRIAKMPEGLSCYFERSAEQVARVAAVLTAAERKTKISKKAVEAAWAFVRHSMLSVEQLVTQSADAPKMTQTKPLPDRLVAVLTAQGGEASRTWLLRKLGVPAADFAAAVSKLENVEEFTGETESGKGRPPVMYRLVGQEQKERQGDEEEVPEESPQASQSAAQPVTLRAVEPQPTRRRLPRTTPRPRATSETTTNPFLTAL